MAICDKISTVGNKLQNNLNARGVSCTYGKTVQSKQDLEAMADLIVSSNLKGSADYLLSLTASRPYLLENETTDLIARLTNGLGVPQANKEITIYNNQGGALLLPDNWTVTNGSVSVSGKNITLTATSATNLFIVDPGLSFEDYNVTFTLQPGVSLYWSVTNGTPSNKLNASVGGRVISLEKKGSTLYRKVGSTQLGAIEEHNGLIAFELSDSGSATVQCSNDASLYRGLTNLNGIFTLYNVSVSQDTTFTATYGTVSDSCLVEYCVWVDYGVATEHIDHYYYNSNNGSVTVTDTGTKLQNSSGNFDLYFIPLDQTVSSSNIYKWNAQIIIEFDVVEDNASSGEALFSIYSNTTNQSFFDNIDSTETGHWKFVLNSNNTQVCYFNGVQQKTGTATLTNVRIGFRVTNQKYLSYKNFRIRAL